MVQRVTGDKAVPPEVLQQIVAKTDGVPLFVEELTKTVVESGLLTAVNDHYELSGPLPPLTIPATLQDSLMARLDRLSAVRVIAQLGATRCCRKVDSNSLLWFCCAILRCHANCYHEACPTPPLSFGIGSAT